MAGNYYDMTGVLVLDAVTPVIRALYGAWNLDGNYPGNGEAYVAYSSESTNQSWEAILDSLQDLSDALGLDQQSHDAKSPETMKDILQRLAIHFGVQGNGDFIELIANNEFEDDADLDSIFVIARTLDDGHGLRAFATEAAWHCSKPRLFEFGGEGAFVGTQFRISGASTRIVQLGKDVENALEAGNSDEAATAIFREFNKTLSGIQDVAHGARVRRKLVELLSAPTTTADVQWTDLSGPMSDRQYVAYKGVRCPSCGGEDLCGSQLDVAGGAAYQPMDCHQCGASWSDTYALTGYAGLDGGIDHDAVGSVVDDVNRRRKEYGISCDNDAQVRELVGESSQLLGIQLSGPELEVAVSKLLA